MDGTFAATSLKNFLTPENPLGPFRHEKIMRRAKEHEGDALIYKVRMIDEVMIRHKPIVIGRRGAGKTAIVAAVISASTNDSEFESKTNLTEKGDIYVLINSWDHLDKLVMKVGADAAHQLGPEGDWLSLLSETVSRLWSRRIWMTIVQQFYRLSLNNRDLRAHLTKTIRYVQNEDVGLELTEDSMDAAFEAVKTEVLNYLETSSKRCFVVIDSLEEYPVMAPRFQKLISGLLKCVNDFNDQFSNVYLLCCIPEEIEPFVRPRSTNRLKDMSEASSAMRLRWRPIDLLRIVADRYRNFINLQVTEERAFLREIRSLDFSNRRHVGKFFDLVLPRSIVNKLGRSEFTVPYIIRHTQLLPREFLMIFDYAIRNSFERNGAWTAIDSFAIVSAVEAIEPDLADQILSPYIPLYHCLIDKAQEILPELKPVFLKSDMDRMSSRLEKVCRHETPDPWKTLFEIGVIGYMDAHRNAKIDSPYRYGYFHYNAKSPITFVNDQEYCVHPIFSGTWRLRRPGDRSPCLYPSDVTENPWQEQEAGA